jgi:ubiquinone biosynthesis protein UbiJ
LAYQAQCLGTCSIRFRLRRAELGVVVLVQDGRFDLSFDQSLRADVSITGNVADLLAMAKTQREGTALAAGKVDIEGDLAVAQQVQSMLATMSFDLEGMLAEFTGDVFARMIGRGARGGMAWIREAHRVLEGDLSEYLRYETRLLPSAPEIESFVHESATLANDVERLRARALRIARSRTRT